MTSKSRRDGTSGRLNLTIQTFFNVHEDNCPGVSAAGTYSSMSLLYCRRLQYMPLRCAALRSAERRPPAPFPSVVFTLNLARVIELAVWRNCREGFASRLEKITSSCSASPEKIVARGACVTVNQQLFSVPLP